MAAAPAEHAKAAAPAESVPAEPVPAEPVPVRRVPTGDAVAASQTAPVFWERNHTGFLDKMMAAAQKHDLIEDCTQEPGNLEGLAALHSKFETDGNAMKTLNIEPFIFSDATRGVETIKRLEEKATSGEVADAAKTRSTSDNISNYVAAVKALELEKIADAQEEKRTAVCANLKRDAALLEEIVVLKGKKGRDEVLADVYGAEAVEGFDSGKKANLYKLERAKRIAQRRLTADGEAKQLCCANWNVPLTQAVILRQNILDETTHAEDLKEQAREASETEEEVAAIIQEIENTSETLAQQLEACKAEKSKVQAALKNKRKVLINILQQLFVADCDFSDTYCEHEALRIQAENLKQRSAKVAELGSAAELAAQTAVDACRQWRENAVESETELRTRIKTEVEVCQQLMMFPTRAAAFNIQLAEKLLTNASQDADGEKSSIEKDLHDKKVTQNNLEKEMVLENPERDIDEIEADHAQLLDEQKSLDASLEKSNSMHEQLQASLGQVATNWKTVQDFFGSEPQLKEFFDAENVEVQVQEGALELADGLYKDYGLWRRPKGPKQHSSVETPRVQATPAAANTEALALATIDQNLKDWMEKMIAQKAQEQAKELFEQFRADMLLRPPGSTTSSEAGDPWVQVQALES